LHEQTLPSYTLEMPFSPSIESCWPIASQTLGVLAMDRVKNGRVSAFFILLLGFAAASILSTPAPADEIILKDGHILTGYVKRESKTIIDPASHEPIILRDGFFMIDDHARRTVFNPAQVAEVIDKNLPPEETVVSPRYTLVPSSKKIPIIREEVRAGPWNEKWNRAWEFRTPFTPPGKAYSIEQHMAGLTPTFTRIDATTGYNWSICYLTSELGPQQVSKLLALHPDFQETRKEVIRNQLQIQGILAFGSLGPLHIAPFAILKSDLSEEEKAARRFRAFSFFVQAGWFPEAEAKLDSIAKDFPSQKEKVDAARAKMKALRALLTLEEIRLARKAGRHEAAQRLLKDFPDALVSERELSEIRTLRSNYETAVQNTNDARRYLEGLIRATSSKPVPPLLIEAAKAIHDEIQLDDFLPQKEGEPVGRLDVFLTQAKQADARKAKSQTPDYNESQLLSFAATGWVMGNTFAESKSEAALRLWKARQFALGFMNKASESDRLESIKKYNADKKEALPADEMAQLVPYLPPFDPEKDVSKTAVETKTRLPGSRTEVTPYVYLLPPEYHHGRAHPVLLVLHDDIDGPNDMIRRWSEYAGKHGYILVAPEWRPGWGDDKKDYRFSVDENRTVLNVLRDVRRRFSVDSDRVFLSGLGQGGVMSYDVGLGHPDLFAGVIPMGGAPFFHAQRYWRNGQYLPFYVVCGDHAGEFHKENYNIMRDMMPRNFPMIYVQYKGRGAEWFGGEVPAIFDWMDRKKRANPQFKLGTDGLGGTLGEEFCTMRKMDNHFYWLSTDGIAKRCLNEEGEWKSSRMAATVTATIKNNVVTARIYGIEDLTIWLGRGTVDFNKKFAVWVNNSVRLQNKVISPNLEVLLGDLFDRCDRQRLFLDKVVLDKKRL
jgi:enterochelin esterase-like enzyme